MKTVHPYKIHLNEGLIKSQKLEYEDIHKLGSIHMKKIYFFNKLEELDPIKDRIQIKTIAQTIQELEFEVQEAWKFGRDINYHTWWIGMPHCSCPQMDNKERQGTGYYIMNQSCVVHGDIEDLI